MTSSTDRSRAFGEIAEILAGGYLRLLAFRRSEHKDCDMTAHFSENPDPESLDNLGEQRDVSKTNTSATGQNERDCYV